MSAKFVFFVCTVAVVLATSEFMSQLCTGGITTWIQVPHDQPCNQNDVTERDACKEEWVGDYRHGPGANGAYRGKDFWYYKNDWRERIANGDLAEFPLNEENPERFRCDSTAFTDDTECADSDNRSCVEGVDSAEACRVTCSIDNTTNDPNGDNQYCRFFAWDQANQRCWHWHDCNWTNKANVPNSIDTDWIYNRLLDITPAGFKSYSLAEFNEPPVCLSVPHSANKKVEVMIETDSKDSRVCIIDGSDLGVSNNNVGNIKTCDNGQLYACFNGQDNSSFEFYIFCDEACEASDVQIWVRIRISEGDWDTGKTTTEDDIEMWCEMEKTQTKNIKVSAGEIKDENNLLKLNGLTGETVLSSYPSNTWEGKDGDYYFLFNDYTWPSEINPREPANYPFRISKGGLTSSANGYHCKLLVAFVTAVIVLF